MVGKWAAIKARMSSVGSFEGLEGRMVSGQGASRRNVATSRFTVQIIDRERASRAKSEQIEAASLLAVCLAVSQRRWQRFRIGKELTSE